MSAAVLFYALPISSNNDVSGLWLTPAEVTGPEVTLADPVSALDLSVSDWQGWNEACKAISVGNAVVPGNPMPGRKEHVEKVAPTTSRLLRSGGKISVQFEGVVRLDCASFDEATMVEAELRQCSMLRQALAVSAYAQRRWLKAKDAPESLHFDALNVMSRPEALPTVSKDTLQFSLYDTARNINSGLLQGQAIACQKSIRNMLNSLFGRVYDQEPLYVILAPLVLSDLHLATTEQQEALREQLIGNNFDEKPMGEFKMSPGQLVVVSPGGSVHAVVLRLFEEAANRLEMAVSRVRMDAATKKIVPVVSESGELCLKHLLIPTSELAVVARGQEAAIKRLTLPPLLTAAELSQVAGFVAKCQALSVVDISNSVLPLGRVNAEGLLALFKAAPKSLVVCYAIDGLRLSALDGPLLKFLQDGGVLDRLIFLSEAVCLERDGALWRKRVRNLGFAVDENLIQRAHETFFKT